MAKYYFFSKRGDLSLSDPISFNEGVGASPVGGYGSPFPPEILAYIASNGALFYPFRGADAIQALLGEMVDAVLLTVAQTPADWLDGEYSGFRFHVYSADALGAFTYVLGPDAPPPPPPYTLVDFVQAVNADVLRINLTDAQAGADAKRIELGLSKGAYMSELIVKAEDSTLPALITFGFLMGDWPVAERLDALTAFVARQVNSPGYQATANPRLGGYEAMGLGLSDTAAFQAYGGGPDQDFVVRVYNFAFERAPTTAQVNHFRQQIDYFEALYLGAGVPADVALMRAQGAVFGQMFGYAAAEPGNDHHDAAKAYLQNAANGVALAGVSSMVE